MIDIWIALLLMLFIGSLLFAGICFLYRKFNQRHKIIMIVGVIAIIIFYMWLFSDSVISIKLLPFKAVVVYSNLFIPCSGILAAFIWKSHKLPQWRRFVIITLLVTVACVPIFKILLAQSNNYHNVWNGDICIQSDQTSCAPAAGATLLKQFGIDTNETEMAALCFTGKTGTSLCGLYRGLRIKNKDSCLRVIVENTNINELQSQVQLPAILILKLNRKVHQQEPRYSEQWGWQVGVSHSVVLFEFLENDQILVGDPSVGKEKWSLQSLQDLWHGTYITIN